MSTRGVEYSGVKEAHVTAGKEGKTVLGFSFFVVVVVFSKTGKWSLSLLPNLGLIQELLYYGNTSIPRVPECWSGGSASIFLFVFAGAQSLGCSIRRTEQGRRHSHGPVKQQRSRVTQLSLMRTQNGIFLFWHFAAPCDEPALFTSPWGQNRPPTHAWRLFVLKSDLLDAGIYAPTEAIRGGSDAPHWLNGRRDAELPLTYLHVAIISDIEGHIAAGFPFNLRC